MINNIGQKIAEFIEKKNISIRTFEREAGLTNGLISKVIKHNTSFSIENLEKIANTYPDLDLEWLIRGKEKIMPDKREIEIIKTQLETLQSKLQGFSV